MRQLLPLMFLSLSLSCVAAPSAHSSRERASINAGWRFTMGDPAGTSDSLRYDVRPQVNTSADGKAADAMPDAAEKIASAQAQVLKPWILPSGNAFIADPARRHQRPAHEPRLDVAYLAPHLQ